MPEDHFQTKYHAFLLSNPIGPSQNDLPALLRRLADEIAKIPDANVQDIVFGWDVNEHGDWWRATVYYTWEDPT